MSSTVARLADMSMENFKENVHYLTKRRQGAVAEAAGLCSRQHLNDILGGRYIPNLLTAIRIASAVGYELGELLKPHATFLLDNPKTQKLGKIPEKQVIYRKTVRSA